MKRYNVYLHDKGDLEVILLDDVRTMLNEIATHPAGAWMSAALHEDSGACDECKRDFEAWFDWLEETGKAIC